MQTLNNLLPVSRETKQEIAVHLAKGFRIISIKLSEGFPVIEIRGGKSYVIESINDRNFIKLIRLWSCPRRYLFLENHTDQAVLSNYRGLEVFCCVREV